MSDVPKTVDGQVTDAVTQANVTVVGSAPAMVVGMLYQTTMHALTLAMQNATFAQQQANIASQAATTLAVSAVLRGGVVGPVATEGGRADG